MNVLAALLNVLIPGWGFVILRRIKLALATQGLLIGGVLVICGLRWILNPSGMSLLIGFIVAVHCVAGIAGFGVQPAQAQSRKTIICLFPIAFLSAVLALYELRGTLLGIDVYHITSTSMVPTLKPNDFVIVNTWIEPQDTEPGSIIVFKDNAKARYVVKRLYANSSKRMPYPALGIPAIPNQHVFAVGDNLDHSIDSRHIGTIKQDQIIGVAKYIVVSMTSTGRITLSRIQAL